MKRTNTFKPAVLTLKLTLGTVVAILVGGGTVMAANFVPTINNPFFPLIPGTTFIYEGVTDHSPVRDEFAVTHDTRMIQGVVCTVIRDRSFVDGVLEEDTLDWFAQDTDGNVWYFGEDAKKLDPQGHVVSTEGSWEAGVNGATPGIVMEAHPKVGDSYAQEVATGVAEDHATVLSMNKSVKVPYGKFNNCLRTSETSPLDPGVIEEKYYASGVGFIYSTMTKGGKEKLSLTDIVRDNVPLPGFTTVIDNPLFPLHPGTTFIYEGTTDGDPTRDEFAVTHDTKMIMDVICTVIRDRGFVNGVLEEDTTEWFAQDNAGNVWYFGEDTKELDPQGNVTSTEGSWEAGVNGAQPGIVMEAHPQVGDTYQQEVATGVAEDEATVLSLKKTVKVPYGQFKNCLQTGETSRLEPDVVEAKYYASGVGFIYSTMTKGGKEKLSLVSIQQGP